MKLEQKLNKDENWKNPCHSCKIECDGERQEQLDCCKLGNHAYSEIECACGKVFCWDCTPKGGDNPHWVECPECGKILEN